MSKQEFLTQLRQELSGLRQNDIEERLTFYGEIIDDRIEEGLSEEEAVSAVGSVEQVASQIIADIPLAKIAKEKIKPRRRLKAWEIVLLALGAPIWLTLGIAALAVILSVYVSIWAVIISLWAVFGSLVGCALGVVVSGVIVAYNGSILPGIAMCGAGSVCAGLSIFMFYGCKAATNSLLKLTKKTAISIKNSFLKKEGA